MGLKLVISIISALLVCCNARSLEPSECQLNKFLLAYYGICPIDQSETGICIDMCTGELIKEEYHCTENPECCWDGQQCTFKQIQSNEVETHKLLSRVRRQTTATGGVERESDGPWTVHGLTKHQFLSGSASGSASYTQGHPGPQLGASFTKNFPSGRGNFGGSVSYMPGSHMPPTFGASYNRNLPSGRGSIGGHVSYMPGSRQPPTFGVSYNRNLWGGRLSGSINHTPGMRTPSFGISFSRPFGK